MMECYICTFETEKLSNCKCKNMVLHEECQLKLINSKNNSIKCSMCNTEYINVALEIVETKTFNCGMLCGEYIIIRALELMIWMFLSSLCIIGHVSLPDILFISFMIDVAALCCIAVSLSYILAICIHVCVKSCTGLYDLHHDVVIKIISEEDINRIV
jgi:hypothetical protein